MTNVSIPGGRDVRGTLEEAADGDPADGDSADGSAGAAPADAPDDRRGSVVLACPPHPRHGGHRGDRRLVAVSEAVRERGADCLRFDYGPWDEGLGEREDVRNAIRWAADRYDRIGVFGFSFGAGLALLATATVDRDVDAVCVLAPPASLGPDLDVVAALDDLEAPLGVVYGERDSTVDWAPVVERATERGADVREFSADHFFVGQHERVARAVADALERSL